MTEATVPDSRPTQPSPAFRCCDGMACEHEPHALPLCASCGKDAGDECQRCHGANQKVTLAQIKRWRSIEEAALRLKIAREEYTDPKKRKLTSADSYRAAADALNAALRGAP